MAVEPIYPGQFEPWLDDFAAIACGLRCDSVEQEILAARLNRRLRKMIKEQWSKPDNV